MPLYPDQTIMLGYSGGMALLIPTWEDSEILFPITVFKL